MQVLNMPMARELQVHLILIGLKQNLQAKTGINASTSSQTIEPDTGYDGLSSLQINAIPSGTAGTPSATKGTVSNHSISLIPRLQIRLDI